MKTGLSFNVVLLFKTDSFCKRQTLYHAHYNRSGPTYAGFIAMIFFFPNLEPFFFPLISAIFSLKCFSGVSAALDCAIYRFALKKNLPEEGKSKKHTEMAIQGLGSRGRNAAWRDEGCCYLWSQGSTFTDCSPQYQGVQILNLQTLTCL